MPDVQTFHLFPLLPLELRLRIWFFSLPPPQLVSLVAYHEDRHVRILNRLLEKRHLERDSEPSPSDKGAQRMKLVGDRCFILAIKSPSPLLRVNHESRTLLLNQHQLFYSPDTRPVLHLLDGTPFGSSNWKARGCSDNPACASWLTDGHRFFNAHQEPIKRPPVLFNPKLDVLFLADPCDRSQYSALSVVVQCLDEALLLNIQMLGLSYFTWRKDRLFKNLGELSRFKSLKKLCICFEGCGQDVIERGDLVGNSGGWLEAVRQEAAYDMDERLKLVEREVLEDMKEMETTLLRKGAVWIPPIVRVVRDRKALVEGWKG